MSCSLLDPIADVPVYETPEHMLSFPTREEFINKIKKHGACHMRGDNDVLGV
jgi:hypothetical protein